MSLDNANILRKPVVYQDVGCYKTKFCFVCHRESGRVQLLSLYDQSDSGVGAEAAEHGLKFDAVVGA
jgi:hypothetical protein